MALLFSRLSRVQGSFLTCLPVCVFPAERRVKMCWRLRVWRLLACCRVEYSLGVDRHCRVVSTRRSKSLSSTLYSILFVSFLHHHVSPAIAPTALSLSFSGFTVEQPVSFVSELLCNALITFKPDHRSYHSTRERRKSLPDPSANCPEIHKTEAALNIVSPINVRKNRQIKTTLSAHQVVIASMSTIVYLHILQVQNITIQFVTLSGLLFTHILVVLFTTTDKKYLFSLVDVFYSLHQLLIYLSTPLGNNCIQVKAAK